MMDKIMLSEEGVETLRHFANQLQEIYDEYVESGNHLIREMELHKEKIGYDGEAFSEMIGVLQTQLNDIVSVFGELHDYCIKSAEKLENALGKLTPDLTAPRDLPLSQYGMERDGKEYYIYDSPLLMDRFLYKTQGMAYKEYQGTCGLCSCANVLRLAGVKISEKEMIDYASKVPGDWTIWGRNLCVKGMFDFSINGGTSPKDRKQILEHFGVSSNLFPIEKNEQDGSVSQLNIERMGKWVSEGRGVIISVHAGMLWENRKVPFGNDFHAVTLTSVKKDLDGTILGFYVCDSKRNGTSYYEAEKIKEALTGSDINVTQTIIR